jgi:hypothetical protein
VSVDDIISQRLKGRTTHVERGGETGGEEDLSAEELGKEEDDEQEVSEGEEDDDEAIEDG